MCVRFSQTGSFSPVLPWQDNVKDNENSRQSILLTLIIMMMIMILNEFAAL